MLIQHVSMKDGGFDTFQTLLVVWLLIVRPKYWTCFQLSIRICFASGKDTPQTMIASAH